jgi:hypothetical protein
MTGATPMAIVPLDEISRNFLRFIGLSNKTVQQRINVTAEKYFSAVIVQNKCIDKVHKN